MRSTAVRPPPSRASERAVARKSLSSPLVCMNEADVRGHTASALGAAAVPCCARHPTLPRRAAAAVHLVVVPGARAQARGLLPERAG